MQVEAPDPAAAHLHCGEVAYPEKASGANSSAVAARPLR
jgi:hypothetical protein